MRLPFGFEVVKHGGERYLTRRPRTRLASGRRSFSAAQQTDLTHSWTSTPQSINEMLADGLTTLRARSRDLATNSDHGAKFIKLVKGNVVGPNGLVLQARSLNRKGQQDKAANSAIEEEFKRWGNSDSCSMCGQLSWIDLQDLFISSVAKDGEAIFRKVGGAKAGPWGFSLSQVDPSLLDVRYNHDLANGNSIRMGIELNGWLRPVAYHFREEGAGAGYYMGPNGKNYLRIPAEHVIHRFVPECVNQIRGVPWMAPSMMRMKMFAGFEEAAVVNARVGASKIGVVKTPDGEYTGSEGKDPVTGDQLMDAEPGSWITLAEGEDIGAWDPTYPNGEFKDFATSVLQSIASGLGVDHASLTGDLSKVNYSSIRWGGMEVRDYWKKQQGWMIQTFAMPVYLEWLSWALGLGMIKIGPTPLNIYAEEKYRRVKFQGRRWAAVDPLKEGQSWKLAVEEGFMTRSEVIRERGQDPDEVWEELAAENEKLNELGIKVGADALAFTAGNTEETDVGTEE